MPKIWIYIRKIKISVSGISYRVILGNDWIGEKNNDLNGKERATNWILKWKYKRIECEYLKEKRND